MRRIGFVLVVAAALLAACAGVAQVASAAKVVDSFLGNPTSSTGTTGGLFNGPRGVAVRHSTGDVYVVDGGNHRVQQFDASRGFVRAWGTDVVVSGAPNDTGTGFEVCNLAHPTTPNVAGDCKAGTTAGTGAGGQLSAPRGVAVDQVTGHVFVTDGGRLRVQEFTATGEFVRAWGQDVVISGAPNDAGTGFEVCDTAHPVTPNSAADCKAGVSGTAGGSFGATFAGFPYVAPVGAPNAGNVLVADPGNRRVQEFTATGGFVRAFGLDVAVSGGTGFEVCTDPADCKAGVAGATAGAFSANQPVRVAADTAGAIYTVEQSGNLRVQKFSPQLGSPALGPEVFAPEVLSSTSGTAAPLDIDIDSSTGRVFVAKGFGPSPECGASFNERRVLELTAAGGLVDTHLACAGISNFTGDVAIAVRPGTGQLFFSANNGAGNGRHGVYIADDDGATPASATVDPAVVTSDTAQLSGTVDPNSADNLGPIAWRVQYSIDGADWTTVSEGAIPAGSGPTLVAGTAVGLRPNTVYLARIVTQKPFGNAEAFSAEVAFETAASAPEIRTTAVQTVAPTVATVSARINPHSTPTSYRFEWGQQGSFTKVVPAPDGSVGSGSGFVLVTQDLAGLEPGVSYQFRAVASSSAGTAVGPTVTFTTPTQPPPPDRAYELVSPPDKVGGSGLGVWYAGPGSHGISGNPAYEADRFVSLSYYGGTLADGGFAYASDAALGERTPGGWVNRPGFNRPGGFGSSEFAKLPLMEDASDDLSLTMWAANSQMQIFAEQEETFGGVLPAGPALREWESGRWEIVAPVIPTQVVGQGVSGYEVAADGGYALVFGALRGVGGLGDPTHPGFSDGPSDLVCASPATCNRNVYVDDVSAGLSDSFPGEGVRSLVNVCTGSGSSRTAIPSVAGGKIVAEACPAAPAGRPADRLISTRGASLSSSRPPGQISDDGSRVFFMSPDHMNGANLAACSGAGPEGTACPPQVYVRQRNVDGSVTTRWVSQSAVAGQDATLMAAAIFEGATPDGDKVFFRTASPLTADDPNGDCGAPCTAGAPSSSSVDLYMYDLPDGPDGDPATADGDPAGGTLTRISAGPTGASDANVLTGSITSHLTSALRAFGADGSRVYFATAAPLAGVGGSANGTITEPDGTANQSSTRNLYLYDATRPVAQRWRFIARLPVVSPLGECATLGSIRGRDGLSAGGNSTGLTGTIMTDPGGPNCLRTTADGSFVSLFTDGRLTADDPDGVLTGDVYGYDAVTDELVRLSAAQGGEGGSYVCDNDPASPVVGARCHGDPFVSAIGSRPPLNVADSGVGVRTVFFESRARLVPGDRNGVYDVYQWRNGRLSLVSTGAPGADDALYRGSDRAGTNVYISTRDALSWQDHDKVLDVYSARVGGGIPQPPDPPVCSLAGDLCQAPPAAAVGIDARSVAPGGRDAAVRPRMRFSIRRPSARALRRAARKGVIRLRVRSRAAGSVRVVAKARSGKGRARRVAVDRVRFVKAGVKTARLRLSRPARRRLAAKRRLRVGVVVLAAGERRRSLSFVLRRPR